MSKTMGEAESSNQDSPKSKGFKMSIAVLIILQIISILLIITVGLLSGLVFREEKTCVQTTVLSDIVSYSVYLSKIASLQSSLVTNKEIYGSVINVTEIEKAVNKNLNN